MLAGELAPASRRLPGCEIRRVSNGDDWERFREIGSACFNVPRHWFDEVFDQRMSERTGFQPWLAVSQGVAVATAAIVPAEEAIGIYNVGTLAHARKRGYAEELMRAVVKSELESRPGVPVVLQSTVAGLELYRRLGFRVVTRFRVWIS